MCTFTKKTRIKISAIEGNELTKLVIVTAKQTRYKYNERENHQNQ